MDGFGFDVGVVVDDGVVDVVLFGERWCVEGVVVY